MADYTLEQHEGELRLLLAPKTSWARWRALALTALLGAPLLGLWSAQAATLVAVFAWFAAVPAALFATERAGARAAGLRPLERELVLTPARSHRGTVSLRWDGEALDAASLRVVLAEQRIRSPAQPSTYRLFLLRDEVAWQVYASKDAAAVGALARALRRGLGALDEAPRTVPLASGSISLWGASLLLGLFASGCGAVYFAGACAGAMAHGGSSVAWLAPPLAALHAVSFVLVHFGARNVERDGMRVEVGQLV